MIPNSLVRFVSRPFPDRVAVYNGVAVRNLPFFATGDFHAHHKLFLWEAVKGQVDGTERVCFVGGGLGVVPVKTVHYGCDVTVIEAAEEMVRRVEDTASLNRAPMRIVHGLVEAGYDIYGTTGTATRLTTGDLAGDVLVLDCEGAERDILPAPQFDTVVVETHPQRGAPTEEIRQLLNGDVEHAATARHHGDFLIRS